MAEAPQESPSLSRSSPPPGRDDTPESASAGFRAAADPGLDAQEREERAEKQKRRRAAQASSVPAVIRDPYVYRCLARHVWEDGDEIIMRGHRRRTLPTDEQICALIDGALQKGWGVLYVYDGQGRPAPRMAARVQQIITARGLQDRIGCCLDPAVLMTLREKKKQLRAALCGAAARFQDAAAGAAPGSDGVSDGVSDVVAAREKDVSASPALPAASPSSPSSSLSSSVPFPDMGAARSGFTAAGMTPPVPRAA